MQTKERGYNQMRTALQKAGVIETPQRTETPKSEYKVLPHIVKEDNTLENPPVYETKHYDNPILQDAYSYIQLIQVKIDNIEMIEKEIDNFNKVNYRFFDNEQNDKLSDITLDYLIRERNNMLDNLSSLMYNEKFTPEIHNIKEDIKKTEKIKKELTKINKKKTVKNSSTTKRKHAPAKKYANNLTPEQVEELIQLYPTSNLKKMGDKYNCSVSYIKKILVSHNVELHTNNKHKKK